MWFLQDYDKQGFVYNPKDGIKLNWIEKDYDDVLIREQKTVVSLLISLDLESKGRTEIITIKKPLEIDGVKQEASISWIAAGNMGYKIARRFDRALSIALTIIKVINEGNGWKL